MDGTSATEALHHRSHIDTPGQGDVATDVG